MPTQRKTDPGMHVTLPLSPMPTQALVTAYGEPGTDAEEYQVACRWNSTLGALCRLCPRPACNFAAGSDGKGMCSFKVVGPIPDRVILALGLPFPSGGG
jgi:hypothetical protein